MSNTQLDFQLIINQYADQVKSLNHENIMLRAEVDALKKLLEEKQEKKTKDK